MLLVSRNKTIANDIKTVKVIYAVARKIVNIVLILSRILIEFCNSMYLISFSMYLLCWY